MSEPPRLLDSSGDELERQLLRAGSAYAASPELREKTLAALGVTGAATAAALGIGAGAMLSTSPAKLGFGSLLAKLGMAKVAMVALGVSAAVVAPLALVGSESEPSQAPRAVVTPPARAKAPAAPAELAAPLPAAAPAVSAASPPGRVGPSVAGKQTASEALRLELAQLEAARSKLKSGRSEEALALLDAYQRSAPRGALRLEAEVLRIDALSRSGRTELAKSRARAFLERHPRSVLAARVRRLAGL